MTVEKCEESSFQTTLAKLCEKRFDLYRKFRRREMSRKEYMNAIAPIDEAVDQLELSMLGGSPTSPQNLRE